MLTSYAKGIQYEALAEKYLHSHGYNILGKRYKTRYGEIDIVAEKSQIICFIEVKYRKYNPENALIVRQMKRIIETAYIWITENYIINLPCMRFDVICISNNGLQYFEHAFRVDDIMDDYFRDDY